jgi:hypothetical protein
VTYNTDGDALLAVPLLVADKVHAAVDDFKAWLHRMLVVVWVLSSVQLVYCWPDRWCPSGEERERLVNDGAADYCCCCCEC